MTRTERREANTRIRRLQVERHMLLRGTVFLNTGVPWCRGPGTPGHQEPLCDGCATVDLCRWKAGHLTEEIIRIRASLRPATQQRLW